MTQAEFNTLNDKMQNDQAFLTACKEAKDEKALYDTYKKFGYTDMEYPEFITTFKSRVDEVVEAGAKDAELGEEDLEKVVGGIGFMAVIGVIQALAPVIGPVLKGLGSALENYNKGDKTQAVQDVVNGIKEGIEAGNKNDSWKKLGLS